jgi:hypothetical protein
MHFDSLRCGAMLYDTLHLTHFDAFCCTELR